MPGRPPVLAEEGRRGDWQLLAWAKNPFGEIIRESGKETAFPPKAFLTQIRASIAEKTYFLERFPGWERITARRLVEKRDRGILDMSNR